MTKMSSDNKVENLVVDTTAFIKNTSLQDIGVSIFTVQEVVDEIINKRQLRNLVVLPYELKIKDVFPENVKFITEFSKKTGDYPSLSATDIKVMALTYQLEKEKVGTQHLKTEPKVNRVVTFTNNVEENHMGVAGFYLPPPKENSAEENVSSEQTSLDNEKNDKINLSSEEAENVQIAEEKEMLHDKGDGTTEEKEEEAENLRVTTVEILEEQLNQRDESYSEDDEEESDEFDDVGWITPSNIAEVKHEMHSNVAADSPVAVACITSDFAMQNVLKQMGLNVVSVDGRLIHDLRTFILRCYACFKTTSIMTKLFCPHCGNKTLKRVAIALREDGTQQIIISARRPLTGRGKRFSLPRPQGGKHAKNPILCEDQRFPHQRPTRLARIKNNPLDPDYIAGFSPFVMRDINSRAAMLGIHDSSSEIKNWMRKNPNEVRRKGRKKK